MDVSSNLLAKIRKIPRTAKRFRGIFLCREGNLRTAITSLYDGLSLLVGSAKGFGFLLDVVHSHRTTTDDDEVENLIRQQRLDGVQMRKMAFPA